MDRDIGDSYLKCWKEVSNISLQKEENHITRHKHEVRIRSRIIWRIQINIKDVVAREWEINTTIHKDFDKVITGKKEEIPHLRDHNQKLLLQIKKAKYKVQCSQKLEEKIQAP